MHEPEALLAPRNRVEVEKARGERVVLEADVVLLATGSRPRHPPGIPMDDPDVHDSESILEIAAVPASVLVIGGGSLGCEYASIFAALGVQVAVVDAGSPLLPALDVEMARVLAESFNSIGIRVIPMVSVSSIAREGDSLADVKARISGFPDGLVKLVFHPIVSTWSSSAELLCLTGRL